MNKIKLVLLFLLILSSEINAQNLKLMTYNIRLDNRNDAENSWGNRKTFLTEQIKFHEPDIFGVQEALNNQIEFLSEQFSNFDYIGVGREDGKIDGEFSAIFYNKIRFKLLAHSTFWLSETPDTPSKGWDAAYRRICTYGYFHDQLQNKNIWVFNTHFDHIGTKARKNSSELIIQKISDLAKNGESVVLMGDLNMEATSEGIKTIESRFTDSYNVSELRFGAESGTFNDFKYTQKSNQRIDYIFIKNESLSVKKYAILNNSYQLRFPSDHFPVMIEVSYK